MSEVSLDQVLSGYGEGEARDSAGENALLIEDDLVAGALKNIQRSKSSIEKQRDFAKRARRFYAGHHYEEADLSYLREYLKSSAAFNVAQKFIKAVSGLERRSREYIDFVPTEVTNTAVGMAGDFVAQAYQWALNKCHGDDERSRAFEDHLVDGLGWTETYLDTMTDPDGLVTLERVDMMEMLWDTNARKVNLGDKEWVARVRLVPFDMAKKRWPDAADYLERLRGGTDAPATDEMTRGSFYEWAANMSSTGDRIDADVTGPRKAKDMIPVIDYQWKDYQEGYYFFDPLEHDDLWLSEDEFLKYKLKLHKLGLPQITDKVRQLKPRYRRLLFAGKWRLFGPVDCPGPRFTYNGMTGAWDDEDGVWLGFMALLMDPQRFANTFLNQALELMKAQSKGGLFAEVDAFVNASQAESNYARSGSIIYMRKDGLAKIKEREMPQTPGASLQLLQFCVNMLQEVTGVGPDTMGISEGNTPTGTTQARARASTALLAPTFSTLRRYRVDEALSVIEHLKFISDGRLIRVGGPQTAQYLNLIRDPFLLRYDILLEEGDSDPNTKQRYFEAIMQITPMLIRTNQFMPELLDYFPLPRRVIEMLKQRIAQAQQQQMQMRQMGMDPTGRGKVDPPDIRQAKIQKLNADTALQMMKAKALEHKGQLGNVEQMLKVLVAQEQSKTNLLTQQHDHTEQMRNALETLHQVFPATPEQPAEGGGSV